ncbi:MAG TPA: AAA family ATPase [Nitratifractor sp.]|nr:AAA family ATPase [Nitratifractor sp.]
MSLQNIYRLQAKLLEKVSLKHKRYLIHKIDWSNRLIGILGQRGAGKTTLMLQYLKEYLDKEKAIYISLDMPYFQTNTLFELAQEFEALGGEYLFIDEVHKYEKWSLDIKSIYDFLDLKVVFSGSSMLQIYSQDADLSRRAMIYNLESLSFREYLKMKDKENFRVYTLEDIISNHTTIAGEITKNIKVLPYFREYLQFGAYPFCLEGEESYQQKIIAIVNQILEVDMPYVTNTDITQIKKIKKMFFMLSQSVPFVPNITDIAKATNISRPKVYEYLEYLERAKLLIALTSKEKGYNILKKPQKLFLHNTNLSYAFYKDANIGTARETFFANQLKNSCKTLLEESCIYTSNQGDFLVNEKYTFEIGGKNKGFQQIKGIKQSFVAADDIEIGFGNKIPLWLFGFLY